MSEALIQKKYFIGTSSKSTWCSVYTYRPQNPEYRKKRGEVFAAIQLKGPEDFSLGTAGGLLLDRFHEAYFENEKDSIIVSLEKALIKAGDFLRDILKNDDADKEGVDLSIIALVIQDDLIFVVSLGGGKLYINREGELNEISSVLKDPTGEGLVKEASLVAKRGDVYLLGTPDFDKEILKQDILQVTEDFTEKPIKTRVFEDSSKVATMLIGYSIDRKNLVKKVEVAEVSNQENQISDKIEEQKEQLEKVEVEEPILPENPIVTDTETEKTSSFELESKVAEINDETIDEDELTVGDLIEKSKTDESDLDKDFEDLDSENDVEKDSEAEKVDNIIDEKLVQDQNINPEEDIQAVTSTKTNPIKSKILILKDSLFSKIKSIKFKKEKPALIVHEGESIKEIQPPQSNIPSRIEQIERQKDIAEMKTYQVIILKIKNFFIGIFKKIKELVWDNWLGFGKNYGDLYLQQQARKRRYGFLFVLIIFVIAILYYSIDGAVNTQKTKEQEELARQKFTEIQTEINTIEEQAIYLTSASGGDERKIQALNKLTEAESKLGGLESYKSLAQEISTEKATIALLKNQFKRIIPITEATVIADLGDIFPNTEPSDIEIANGKIYLSDAKAGKIYSFDYYGNNRAEVASGFTNPKSITFDSNNNTLLVLDDNADNAISIINLSNNAVNKMAATSLSKIAGTTQIEAALIGGKDPRLYLLNPEKKNISYYTRSGNTYSTLINRNNWDDLISATDFKVDEGRIYLTLQKNLGLYRDYNKKEDVINIQRMNEGDNFVAATALYVDGVYVYIADPINKRVLVFKKGTPDIPLVAQYVYSGSNEFDFGSIKEIIADRNHNKIFILNNTKIITLDMNLLSVYN